MIRVESCEAGQMRERIRAAARSAWYLIVGLAVSLLTLLVIVALLVSLAASAFIIGLPWCAEVVRLSRSLAGVERRRAGAASGRPIAARYHELTGNAVRQLGTAATDPASWRDLLWLVIHTATAWMPFALVAYAGSVMIGGALTPLIWALADRDRPPDPMGYTVDDLQSALVLMPAVALLAAAFLLFGAPLLARGQQGLARLLLAPSKKTSLASRVQELADTRTAALDAHAAELRRIERDLHDGSQARLVSIAMRLGLAEQQLASGGDATALVTDARAEAETAIKELRNVVRGIYPPVLADRGLRGALTALATASSIDATAEVDVLGVLPAAVESAAYFVVSEALSNVAKHAHANRVVIAAHREGDTLCMTVTDDGVGGASSDRGSGLIGMQRRVAAHDGVLMISSPPGGPTVVSLEIPCG